MQRESILITGANGQIGTVLAHRLADQFGSSQLITTDINPPINTHFNFEILNVLDKEQMSQAVRKYKINRIYHLAAILSAKAESKPLRSWELNMSGLFNVLEVARQTPGCRVFFPSSIAVYGDKSADNPVRQATLNDPDTVYGISKTAGELWCQYYHRKYQLDVRSIRYPGVIGHQSMPGGGTTDYSVEIFHEAIKNKYYNCFLSENTMLPMIYMPDAIKATLKIMEAPEADIKLRTSYNVAAFSFTPKEISNLIQQHIPEFNIDYSPDFRQQIADKWPRSVEDSPARNDWGWQPDWSLDGMVKDMLENLVPQYNSKTNNSNQITNV